MIDENFDNELPEQVPETEKVDWEARLKVLEEINRKQKEELKKNQEDQSIEEEPSPVTSDVHTHAHSAEQQLAVSGLDKNKKYRWVSKYDPKLKYLNSAAVNQRITSKYEVTSDPDGKIQGPRMMGGSNLETHDLILMETTPENYEKRMMVGPNKSKEHITRVRESHRTSGLEGKMANKKKTYSSTLKMMGEGDSIFEI